MAKMKSSRWTIRAPAALPPPGYARRSTAARWKSVHSLEAAIRRELTPSALWFDVKQAALGRNGSCVIDKRRPIC
jgi:hypothetical protein